MTNLNNLLKLVNTIQSDSIDNYIVDGLNSSLLENGVVRMFTTTHHQIDGIAPHSHRYDFACVVLQGKVTNHLWYAAQDGDDMQVMSLKYLGAPGKYSTTDLAVQKFARSSTVYEAGEIYMMERDQIHNIEFTKGTQVLFFEGPQKTETSLALQPIVKDKEPKMFDTGD